MLESRTQGFPVQVRCAKCSRWIAATDTVESAHGRLAHVDCARLRTLTADERALLFLYCSGHTVAECLACGRSFRFTELAADPLGSRTNMCPRCRKDLTEHIRAHVYSCSMLPAAVLQRAQAVREAARRLVKQSQELADKADVVIREAEVALLDAQQALRAAMKQRPAP
jgi:hypothetical protein